MSEENYRDLYVGMSTKELKTTLKDLGRNGETKTSGARRVVIEQILAERAVGYEPESEGGIAHHSV